MVFGSIIFILLVYIKMCVSLNAGVMTTPIHFFFTFKSYVSGSNPLKVLYNNSSYCSFAGLGSNIKIKNN